MFTSKEINQDWYFTQVGGGRGTKEGEWLKTSSFPTTIHVELLRTGIIPDPFVGLNEHRVQWVGESDWAFKSEFVISEKDLKAKHLDLVFDGLDTYAIIKLNGTEILRTNNQFVPYRVGVEEFLVIGSNELSIVFESAWFKGKRLERQNGKLALWNGDSSRLHVRKAQYNYGWDWGPVLMTVGPWKPVRLESYEYRIEDLRIRADVSESLDVRVAVSVSLGAGFSGATAAVTVESPEGIIVFSNSCSIQNGKCTMAFEAKRGELELWWPVGYGKQPLYTVEVRLTDAQNSMLDTKRQKIGIRRARVVQDQLTDQEGRTFLFEVNNVKIFCGGSNWIPADSFLTTVADEVYRGWLQLLVDGNQNMIRVWGGGVYEADIFYDTCDELGILVWQDFMFSCGQYPAHDEFMKRLVPEVEANIKRLRHHPSLVIFAGNNEDYQLAESLNLELDYNDENPESDPRKTNFPARYIYERILPEITAELSDVHYHRSSPYSGFGKPTTDKTFGDLHQWNVWHGSQEPWHNWDILAGRFVSEFGMEAYPNIRTVDFWVDKDKAERFPQSRTMNSHNKAAGFERRLELYLVENFKHSFDIESYVYYTQIMQAETLASAYRLWRRNWKGPGREYTSGALVWQLNDCWPVTSWSIVDYFLRPKPAYFAIARELKAYTVGMIRKELKTYPDQDSAASYNIETELQVWGTNSTLSPKEIVLEMTAFDLQSKDDWKHTWKIEAELLPNQSTELWNGLVPGQWIRNNVADVPKDIVISARLLDGGRCVLARCSNWPEPFKFIHFPSKQEVGLSIVVAADEETVELSCLKPIKGIVLDAEGEDISWSDQAIDLVPGDPQTIKAIGLKGRKVLARYLGDGCA